MKLAIFSVGLIAFPVLFFSNAYCQETTWEQLVPKIKKRVALHQARTANISYQTDSRTIIKDGNHEIKKTIQTKQRITLNRPEDPKSEILSMIINGKQLNKKEIDQELKKVPSQSSRSPLDPVVMHKYTFQLIGSTTYKNLEVWEVSFQPKLPEKGLSAGVFYIDKMMLDMVFMEFTPSHLPSAVQNLNIKLMFQLLNNMWVPQSSSIKGHIKAAFIITLMEQHMEINETYSRFNFNP